MQVPADPLDAVALDEALQPGRDRRFSHLLEFDWNRDGLFDNALSNMNAAATRVEYRADLDDSTAGAEALPAGAVAAELSVTLSGMVLAGGLRKPIAEVLAPYNTVSALHTVRVPSTPVRWTLYTHTSRGRIPTLQFTGTVDVRGPRRAANEVTLQCYDGAVRLAEPAEHPGWAVDGPAAARVGTSEPQRGLASSLVDHLCNRAGLLTRPRPPWTSAAGVTALAWLPLAGSFAPSVGRMYSIIPWGSSFLFPELYPISPAVRADRVYWTAGPHGLARNADPNHYPGSFIYTPRDSMPVWAGRSTSITAWLYCGPTAPAYGTASGTPITQVHFGWVVSSNYYAFRVSLCSNGTTVRVQVEDGTSTMYWGTYTPGSDAYRHVHAQVDHSAGLVRLKLIVDGVTQVNVTPGGASSGAATILNPLFFPAEGVRIQPGVRVCDVMAWQETGAPAAVPERTFTPGAVIDPSLNEITHLPVPAGSSWETLAAVAAAEYGCVTSNAAGLLRFRNRETVRPAGTPTATITRPGVPDVATTDTAAGKANAAKVSTQAGSATWGRAFELADVDQIVGIPGPSTHVLPTADKVLVPDSGNVPRLCQTTDVVPGIPPWSDKIDSGWVFCFDQTETEELTNQSLVNTSDQTGLDDAQLVRVEVDNADGGGRTGRFRLKQDTTSGSDPQTALRIGGLILALDEAQVSTVLFPAAIAREGRQVTLDLGSGPWYQHPPSAEATARFALRRASQAIPTFGAIQTAADPRREVTDGCLLLLGNSGQRVVAFVAGITRALEVSGDEATVTETVTVRPTHAPGRWALGDPVLGRLADTATLG